MDYISVVNSTGKSGLGIYCPRCGVQALQIDSKFCRACGVDLILVSEAVSGHIGWRTHLRTWLESFSRKREPDDRRSAREAALNIILGCAVLPMSIWCLATNHGSRAYWGILLVVSLLWLKIGIGNLLLYKRYLERNSPAEIIPDKGDLIVLGAGNSPRASDSLRGKTTPAVLPSASDKTTEFFEAEQGDTQ